MPNPSQPATSCHVRHRCPLPHPNDSILMLYSTIDILFVRVTPRIHADCHSLQPLHIFYLPRPSFILPYINHDQLHTIYCFIHLSIHAITIRKAPLDINIVVDSLNLAQSHLAILLPKLSAQSLPEYVVEMPLSARGFITDIVSTLLYRTCWHHWIPG